MKFKFQLEVELGASAIGLLIALAHLAQSLS